MSNPRAPKSRRVGVVATAIVAGWLAGCDLVQLRDYRDFGEWYSDVGIGDERIQAVHSGLSDEHFLGSFVNYDVLRTPVFAAYEAARTVLIPVPAVYYPIAGAVRKEDRGPDVDLDPGWDERANEARLEPVLPTPDPGPGMMEPSDDEASAAAGAPADTPAVDPAPGDAAPAEEGVDGTPPEGGGAPSEEGGAPADQGGAPSDEGGTPGGS